MKKSELIDEHFNLQISNFQIYRMQIRFFTELNAILYKSLKQIWHQIDLNFIDLSMKEYFWNIQI